MSAFIQVAITQFLLFPISVQVCIAVLAFLFLTFICFFLCPAVVLWWRLGLFVRKLGRLSTKNKTKLELAAIFKGRGRLAHHWKEYSETLHEQRELNAGSGLQEIVAIRSMVPAEAFFNAQSVIDSRLST